jgi:hypothetical protein
MGEQDRHWSKFSAYGVAAVVVAVVALLAFSWTEASTDLTLGHASSVLLVGLGAALATVIVVLALVFWLKPPLRGPRFLGGPLLALATGLMAGLLAFDAADRVIQALEFRGGVVRYDHGFRVSRAYVSHGKGVSYHLQLCDPFADFTLSPDDYRNTFGNSEELSPRGYCLQAPVEQRGDAMRIMYPSGRPIPPGRARPCSAAT